ncbi:hypothetical protein Gohar_013830 [Gossypium harknessii]|uniref:Uncharacterized protein n=1 Tax=Gossypium harknessii TaxID=34285 RepID=A0A7J9H1J4_9ROSI|nr:hypothetical protein [Gossypium harknessii]
MKFPKLWILFLVLLVTVQSKLALGTKAQYSSKQAYVMLLYGDEFLLGVRVLGKSIRDTGSTKDMVVLVSDGVSDYAKKLLEWMVDESELRVIHYTLGQLKPWDWWTSWLLKPVDVWQNVRERLEETLPATGGGKNPNDELLVKFLSCYLSVFYSFVTIVLLFRHLYFMIRSSGTVAYSDVSSSSNINVNNPTKVPVYLGGISVFVCFMAVVVSLGISIAIVPRQVMPWTGLFLMYEWTFTIFFHLFGAFPHLIYQRGRRIVTQLTPVSADTDLFNSDSKKDHRQASSCDIVSWYYGLGMAFLAIVAPSLPCIFGIAALFLRLGLMVVEGIILASFMTYASEHLAIRSFLKGCEDWDTTQSRECFLC